jgi:predicted Fe-S protein YdhL (DUF1289 family)
MMIATPCVKTCVIDVASGLCRGCGRTLAEIGGWASMTNVERVAIMENLAARMKQAGIGPINMPEPPTNIR